VIYETEDRWKPANARCPHPERWHSADADSTEVEVSELVAAFVRALQPNLVVETGSAWGQTTTLIAEALFVNECGFLVSLETDPERWLATICRVDREEVGGHWSVLEESSLEWDPEPYVQDYGPIDLVFSDSYGPIRIPEVVRLLPFMRKDATVIFHDTAPEPEFPFRRMIEDELVSTGIIRCVDLPTPRGVSICQVLQGGAG
jgi:predicted O-methyltransferase YrrM